MKRIEYEFDGYLIVFVADDKDRVWVAPFTYMTIDTLIDSFPEDSTIVVVGATDTPQRVQPQDA